MNSYWVRLNAVFFYGLNVLLGLAIAAWVSCFQQDFNFHSEMPRKGSDTKSKIRVDDGRCF